jgi:integrase
LFGLRKGDIDFLRPELHYRHQIVSPSKGSPLLAPVKAKTSIRTIGLSTVVLDALSAHLAAFGIGPNEVIFNLDGRYVSRSAGVKLISRAGRAVGMPSVGWPALRHWHASVLLSEEVSPA